MLKTRTKDEMEGKLFFFFLCVCVLHETRPGTRDKKK